MRDTAERRMFSTKIVYSGKFIKMSPTARLLYYDLGMKADDDGIVEAYPVMTLTKASEDDLRVLVAKGYVSILNDDLVAQIMDWNINNQIRQDRYHRSIYSDLLLKIGCQNDNQMTTNGCQNDNQMATEVRLGKDSIGKVSIGKSKSKTFTPPTLYEVKQYAEEHCLNVDTDYFFEYYSTGEWHDSLGKPVKNWKQRMITWARKNKDNHVQNKTKSAQDLYKETMALLEGDDSL